MNSNGTWKINFAFQQKIYKMSRKGIHTLGAMEMYLCQSNSSKTSFGENP